MISVPLVPRASQTLTITLARQLCRIDVYQKFFGLFMDLYVNTDLIIGGVVAEDRNRIVRSKYLGFKGDFVFLDTLGRDDPTYQFLGSQFLLLYLTEEELLGLGA